MLHQFFQRPQDILTALDSFVGRTQGSIAYRDSDKWKALTSTNVGYFLQNGGAGANPAWASAWFARGVTSQPSAATTMSLGSLSLALDRAWFVIINIKNATASNAALSIYYNADTTAGNYDSQRQLYQNATLSAGRANDGIIGVVSASTHAQYFGFISNCTDGKPRSYWIGHNNVTTAWESRHTSHMWRTAADITTLVVSSSVATSIDTGSNIYAFSLGALPT